MRITKIVPTLLIAIALSACSRAATDKDDTSHYDVFSIINEESLDLVIEKLEKLNDQSIQALDEEDIAWINSDIDAGKDVYLLSYKLTNKEPSKSTDLDFYLEDKDDNKIEAKNSSIPLEDTQAGRVYFSVDKDTILTTQVTSLNIDGHEILSKSILTQIEEKPEINEDLYVIKNKDIIQTINIAPEVDVNIYDFGVLQKEQMNENEKSNLTQYLKDPADKIYMVDYNITDKRKSGRIIDREMTSDVDDTLKAVITTKNGDVLSPISIFSDLSSANNTSEVSEYYLIQDENKLESISFVANIDGKEIESRQIDMNNKTK